MFRAVRLLLVFGGIVAIAAGAFFGLGTLFSWNGRHAVLTRPIQPDVPVTFDLEPSSGRRYTLAVHVGLEKREAKVPVVARATNADGVLFETKGWVDPSAPPTLVYGDPPNAERLLGSFFSHTDDPVHVTLDLGADREGGALADPRLVVFDDALPDTIRRAIAVAGGGFVAVVAGLFLFVFRRKRSGIRRRPVV